MSGKKAIDLDEILGLKCRYAYFGEGCFRCYHPSIGVGFSVERDRYGRIYAPFGAYEDEKECPVLSCPKKKKP
jgi:cbb3-type cytochrome oxidase cytochrome c subunit